MLPFLKPKTAAGLIIERRKPDGASAAPERDDSSEQGLHQAAEELIRALNAKDAGSVASALRAAFQIMDAEEDDAAPEDTE